MIFKNYLKLFRKNLKTFFIYFGIFSFLFLMASSNIPKDENFKEIKIDILVKDKDKSKISKEFIEYLKNTQNVIETNLSLDDVKTKIFKEEVNAYISINENFKENLKNKKEAITLIGDEKSSQFIFFKINLEKYLNLKSVAINSNENEKEVLDTLNNKINVNILDTNIFKKEITKNVLQDTFRILGYIILGVTMSVVTSIQNSFSNENIEKKLILAPIRPTKILIQKYLAQIIISLLISISFLILIKIKLYNYLKLVNEFNIFISVIVYGISTIAVGNFFTEITSNKQVLNGLTSIFSMITAFISGIFLPEEFIPKYIIAISKFLPTRYFVEFLSNSTSENLIKFILIQILFITFFITSGILIRKQKTRV